MRSDPGGGDRLVINFHGIGEPHDVPDDEVQYWCPATLWPAFADAMANVRDRGGVQLEVTFDDGNLSDIEHALPVLAERGLTAVFHVCAGRIGQPHYLEAGQLRSLRAAGMEIGSHGWNHVDLRRVSDAELVREAELSRARIGEESGGEVTQFAIPFGSYDRRVLGALRGYESVYTSDRSRASRAGWLVPRFSYVRGWQPQDLILLASGRSSLAERLRRRAAMLAKALR